MNTNSIKYMHIILYYLQDNFIYDDFFLSLFECYFERSNKISQCTSVMYWLFLLLLCVWNKARSYFVWLCSYFSQIDNQKIGEHVNLKNTECVLFRMPDNVKKLLVSWLVDHKVVTRNISSFRGVISPIVDGFFKLQGQKI